MRTPRIYGKGFLLARGTSPNVTRLSIFTAAMTVCDPSLEGHATRVAAHAEAVARRLGWTDEAIDDLRLGAALHDVGKVNVRPGVLSKPGRLDDAELAEVRAHPVEGAWLIAGVPSLAPALPYVLFHHERWDGGGYPTHRVGIEIPLEGRLLAVADAFDAMTSARPYCDAARVRRRRRRGRALLRHPVRPHHRRRLRRGVRGGRDRRSGTALRRRLRSARCPASAGRGCRTSPRGVRLQPDAGSISRQIEARQSMPDDSLEIRHTRRLARTEIVA